MKNLFLLFLLSVTVACRSATSKIDDTPSLPKLSGSLPASTQIAPDEDFFVLEKGKAAELARKTARLELGITMNDVIAALGNPNDGPADLGKKPGRGKFMEYYGQVS